MNLKIIIVIVLAFIAAAHFVATSIPNDQPLAALEIALPHLSDAEAIDFDDIELSLTRIQFDHESKPVLDSSTEAILSVLAPYLFSTREPAALARFQLLTSKQFTHLEDKNLSDLLLPYARYKEKAAALEAELAKALGLDEEIEHFNAIIKIQNDALGAETALALFADYRNMARYIYALRLVEQNESLTEQQKQLQLDDLLNKFQQRAFATENVF